MADGNNPLTGAGYQPDSAPGQDPAHQAGNAGGDSQGDGGQPTDTKNNEADVKGQGTDGENSNQGNPLTALVQTRQQHRDSAGQYEAQIAAMQQEIANLRAAQTAPAEPETWKNPFNPEEHPIDYFRAELEHTQAEMRQLKEEGGRQLEDTRNHQALADFEAEVAGEIAMASQTTPELLDAYGFINKSMTAMHRGQGLTGKRLSQAVKNSVLQAFVNGQTSGMSHAQTAANMAINLGYETKGQGKGPKEQIKRGQKAEGQSIGQATGTGGTTTAPSAKQLAQMSTSDLKAGKRENMDRLIGMLQGKIPIE